MTSLLSDKNLEKARKTQEMNLPETAYLQRQTMIDDGQGGFIEGAVETFATVSARLGEPNGEFEKTIASSIQVGKVNVITLPVDTALLDTDQIQINGVNYKIHWTNKNKSHLTALRVMVTEV